MKRTKLELKINMIMEIVSDWCSKKNISFNKIGDYSFYCKLTEEQYESIKEELKSYIEAQLGITKKKIKKMLSVLSKKDRTYFLFKTRMEYI